MGDSRGVEDDGVVPRMPPSWVVKAVRQTVLTEAGTLFGAGLVTGVVVAAGFNPWDRALYLSVKHERPFFVANNWINPYQGFVQACVQRTLSGGLYFPFNDLFLGLIRSKICEAEARRVAAMSDEERAAHQQETARLAEAARAASGGEDAQEPPDLCGPFARFMAGNAAGAINGFLLNGLSVVKYHSWGKENPRYWSEVRLIARTEGVGSLKRGLAPTVIRDVVFGGIFAVLKWKLDPVVENALQAADRLMGGDGSEADGGGSVLQKTSSSSVSSIVAASCATVASAPFNYARNIQYATPVGDRVDNTMSIIVKVVKDARGSQAPLRFLQQRLRIGWGTARVAVGMAAGWEIYSYVRGGFDDLRDRFDSDYGDDDDGDDDGGG